MLDYVGCFKILELHLIFKLYKINLFRTISEFDKIIVGGSHVIYKESENSYL